MLLNLGAATRDDPALLLQLPRDPRQPDFAIDYLPIVDLTTKAVCRLEAQVTWPESGLSANSAEIGGWALARACVEARYWPGHPVAVPFSAPQLESGVLLGQVDAALRISGLPPSRLELHLSEAGPLPLDAASLAVLDTLRARGVGLVLDNFGAGGARLLLLVHLPLTAVKLDRGFLGQGAPSFAAFTTMQAVTRACHAAGRRVIAEGIQSAAQQEFLVQIGCDEGAGPIFSPPLGAELVGSFLDYTVKTCSAGRSTPETPYERAVPH